MKNYKLIKTSPNEVLIELHPISNMALTRRIHLTNKAPQCALPEDWALGIFQDSALYQMYKMGYITFDDNDSIVKAAYENGVYFGEALDFTPAKPNRSEEILTILKTGNRRNIENALTTYGAELIRDVAIANIGGLTQNVIAMLENLLNVQLIPDGE